jgi:SAM-dependent methyltransferase
MDRLTGVEELLDGPLDDEAALVGNLRDLARLNRLTGGTALSRLAIGTLGALGDAGGRGASGATVLDVGTGGADIPIDLLTRRGPGGGVRSVVASDNREAILTAARRAHPSLDRVSGLTLAVADGRALPWRDGFFDVAHASLVLHHLEPVDAVAFLRELRRVSRTGIVVNDLIRGRRAWLGTWLLVHTIARSRFTRHDAPLSVRRAYSRNELIGLLAAAGLTPVAFVDGFAGHRVAIAAR